MRTIRLLCTSHLFSRFQLHLVEHKYQSFCCIAAPALLEIGKRNGTSWAVFNPRHPVRQNGSFLMSGIVAYGLQYARDHVPCAF